MREAPHLAKANWDSLSPGRRITLRYTDSCQRGQAFGLGLSASASNIRAFSNS